MDELTGFQRDVLYISARLDEPNGLAIKDQLEDYYETTVDRGQLYPNLDSLVEKELIEKHQQGKRRNAYTLTAKGRHEITARREWEDKRMGFDA
ncbi:PadR family transcriptional regulator [Halalkalicoccus salilacus]|uniref:PadR family transcriptional regulator n=1 Tax=Halalkalicoccus TaxID=332246 RepID=UPI002F962C67